MRTIVALAVIVATLALGGCFHHTQQVYTPSYRRRPRP